MVNPVKAFYKKIRFEGHNHLQFWNEVFRLPTALPQGQLAEVPLYFKIFIVKIDVQTLWVCSTIKNSKF